MTKLVKNESKLIDVLGLVELDIGKTLRQSASMVMVLDFGGHVDLCTGCGGKVLTVNTVAYTVSTIETKVTQFFLRRW